ncbi:MAG: cell envelope integrity protein TolA [Paracoccus hibiscisoli]|uniref:cell envelope integrity protein TolA n=1 Tax=Paracoccus hibiscisoli TaxID=2023261 RepID=UPI00391A119D
MSMVSRRVLETAGVFTIAAALHVSAAVMMLPQEAQRGAGAGSAPAQVAAGGEAVQAMVADWESPPEIAMPQPMTPQAEPPDMPMAAAVPPAMPAPAMPTPPMPAPEAPAAMPNLPPPRAVPDVEPASQLALDASSRPQARPERRAPPTSEPQREARPRDPAPAEAVRGDRDQQAQRGGQGGSAAQTREAGGGGGASASAAQRDNAMAQWSGRIQSCIGRRASAPRNARGQGTVLLALTVGRDGTIRGVGVAGSSGDAVMDQAAVTAAQRARRCPAAPGALTEAAYPFHLPITLR